jgi:hypothetical protein
VAWLEEGYCEGRFRGLVAWKICEILRAVRFSLWILAGMLLREILMLLVAACIFPGPRRIQKVIQGTMFELQRDIIPFATPIFLSVRVSCALNQKTPSCPFLQYSVVRSVYRTESI